MQQEITNSKKIKIGDAAVQRETRMNPDSTTGLAVTGELRMRARRVVELKEQDKKEAALRVVQTAANKVDSADKKEATFN